MVNEHWNGDIAYAFSIHRICLEICGLWPLQRRKLFARMRYSFWIIVHFTILPFTVMDFIWNDQNIDTDIETILYFVCVLSGIIKCTCIFLGEKKLCMNIKGAINDWLFIKDDEKTRKIMRKHAYRIKILTFVVVYSAIICSCIYILSTVIINVTFFTDSNLVDANGTDWTFIIPCGSLGSLITRSQYLIILSVQSIQVIMLCYAQSIVDTFFFNVTIHLAGQFEVLKYKLKILMNVPDIGANCRRKFIELINRHSELLEFTQNLEDTFSFLLLVQIVMTTVMAPLTGLRIITFLNEDNQIEIIKNIVIMNYLLMQTIVYTCAGDFLQREGEDIFHALYAASWFTLPLSLMKDLHFAMMRSNIPLRLTGGKFFYINRETMMYIFKTSFSYISVLRIALQK